MDLRAVVSSLLRRWYVCVAGLLVTVGLVAAAFQLVPLTYSATASMLLLPSQQSLAEGDNPLLSLGGLDQPTSLAVAYLAGDDIHRQFGEKYPGATFSAVVDTLGRGPLIIFTAEGPTSGETLAALQGAVDLLPGALSTLQDNVSAPDSSRFRSTPLSLDREATTVKSSTLRAVILATGVGLVLTFAGAVAFDSLMVRRTGYRSERQRPTPRDEDPLGRSPSNAPPESAVAQRSAHWVARGATSRSR